MGINPPPLLALVKNEVFIKRERGQKVLQWSTKKDSYGWMLYTLRSHFNETVRAVLSQPISGDLRAATTCQGSKNNLLPRGIRALRARGL